MIMWCWSAITNDYIMTVICNINDYIMMLICKYTLLFVCIESEISRMSLATCSLFRQSRPHNYIMHGRFPVLCCGTLPIHFYWNVNCAQTLLKWRCNKPSLHWDSKLKRVTRSSTALTFCILGILPVICFLNAVLSFWVGRQTTVHI